MNKNTQCGRSGRRSRRGITIGAVALLISFGAAVAGGIGSIQGGHRPTHGGIRANDGHATVGKSEGPVSATEGGLPPASAQATRRATSVDDPNPKHPAHGAEKEEAENGEAQNPGSTQPLIYRGGAVQTAPRIYLVLWGPSWSTNGDPYGVANRLHSFYGGVGGSSIANVLKQYTGSTGAFTNPAGQYKGWIRDTTAVPSYPTKQDMANAAARAAVKLNDVAYNAQYIIATPWGVVDQYSTQNRFCAWHDWTTISGHTGWITYTSMPYIPYMDSIGRGCGRGTVNGSANGVLDGVTILASHEYEETVNDPGRNAWSDAGSSENGDKCSWVNLANVKLANGLYFPVQPSWSNQWRNQYGDGCLYSA